MSLLILQIWQKKDSKKTGTLFIGIVRQLSRYHCEAYSKSKRKLIQSLFTIVYLDQNQSDDFATKKKSFFSRLSIYNQGRLVYYRYKINDCCKAKLKVWEILEDTYLVNKHFNQSQNHFKLWSNLTQTILI